MHARYIMFLALLLFVPVRAGGVNERGMDYRSFKDSAGSPCCSNEDCYAAEKFTETVENGSEVIRLLIDRTWISVPRAYVIGEHATDGRAHWCGNRIWSSQRRGWRPATRCIILPPRLL
jgi:hypothetical protein